MKRKKIYILTSLIVIILFGWAFIDIEDQPEDFSEIVKISLRNVGNQLLLSDKDTTSLVLPIIELEKSKYELSFQNQLEITPDTLVTLIEKSFVKSKLPKDYRVEVMRCKDQEVAYSYEMNAMIENTIIACQGRTLPSSCYTIEVKFIQGSKTVFDKRGVLYISSFGLVALIGFFFFNRKQDLISENEDLVYDKIGSYRFFPDQNKLVKEAVEITLSKKECELLAIFVAAPNQIIKRDELTKRVWEDNGVFVGRSLDTYISKLRKKLKDDKTIKITNVHGVGYKLEIG